MVEWKPLMGALPPMNETDWNRVFDLYKNSPEFQKENFWMGLSDFKTIFFWEWFHRLFGRLIGILYAVPFIFFLIKGWIPKTERLKLLGIFLLGGAQGFMGWYMVKSGLVDVPAVSHYRLAAHLSLAFLIFSLMLWMGLKFRHNAKPQTRLTNPTLFRNGLITLFFLVITIIWGAFVAGLDAGLVYTDTFPKMGKTWIPEEMWFHKPLWLNFFENHAGVQFTHRWLAMFTFLVLIGFTINAFKHNRREICFALIAVLACLQVALGIMTLMLGVPIVIATLHQANAVFLLTALIICLHKTR